MVEAFFYGFGDHGFCGWFEGEVDADGGLFAVDDVAEVADVGDVDVAAFDGDDDALGFICVVVDEGDRAVDAFVGAFLSGFIFIVAAERAGFDEGECPPLELVAVLGGELARSVEVFGLADDAVLRNADAPVREGSIGTGGRWRPRSDGFQGLDA